MLTLPSHNLACRCDLMKSIDQRMRHSHELGCYMRACIEAIGMRPLAPSLQCCRSNSHDIADLVSCVPICIYLWMHAYCSRHLRLALCVCVFSCCVARHRDVDQVVHLARGCNTQVSMLRIVLTLFWSGHSACALCGSRKGYAGKEC